MDDFKRHVGDATDISDRGSIPLTPLMGVPWSRRGIRSVTETCLDKQPIDAKTSDVAANNIVAFSRTRDLATA
jgi:hypothetical protein